MLIPRAGRKRRLCAYVNGTERERNDWLMVLDEEIVLECGKQHRKRGLGGGS